LELEAPGMFVVALLRVLYACCPEGGYSVVMNMTTLEPTSGQHAYNTRSKATTNTPVLRAPILIIHNQTNKPI